MDSMNNTALITGASSGIGEALARKHASLNGDLILVARSEDKLNQMKTELESQYKTQVRILPVDLNQPTSPQKIFDYVKQNDIMVEILINNAGFGGHGYFHERAWEQEQSMIQVNVIALTHLTHLILPDMIQRNRGRILNVASTAALVPGGPLQSVYYATKSYVLSFSYGLAGELAHTEVKVTILCPGATKTAFEKTAGLEKTKLFTKATLTPEQVAQDGYHAMIMGKLFKKTAVTLGNQINLMMVPLVPKRTVLEMIRRMQEIDE